MKRVSRQNFSNLVLQFLDLTFLHSLIEWFALGFLIPSLDMLFTLFTSLGLFLILEITELL